MPEDVTACMNAVVAFVVGVALVAVVEVVGDIGVVAASAVVAVVVLAQTIAFRCRSRDARIRRRVSYIDKPKSRTIG